MFANEAAIIIHFIIQSQIKNNQGFDLMVEFYILVCFLFKYT